MGRLGGQAGCSSAAAARCARCASQGAQRLVLDVRNNGGGLFPSGVEVGRMLLDRGDIVLIADRCGARWAGLCAAVGSPFRLGMPWGL